MTFRIITTVLQISLKHQEIRIKTIANFHLFLQAQEYDGFASLYRGGA